MTCAMRTELELISEYCYYSNIFAPSWTD